MDPKRLSQHEALTTIIRTSEPSAVKRVSQRFADKASELAHNSDSAPAESPKPTRLGPPGSSGTGTIDVLDIPAYKPQSHIPLNN